MKIKIHKHLEPKIWDKNQNINPDVSDMLLSIAWAYIDYIRNEYAMNIRNSDIADILVFGSITQYFYNKQSDIDVCIVLNTGNVEKQFPNVEIQKIFKLYYYDWAMVHICKIYGRKVDLNIQNVKEPIFNGKYRTGPMYSLIKQQWIAKPVKLSNDEIKRVEKQSDIIYKQILNDYKTVKRNGFKFEEIDRLYKNIIASKTQSFTDNTEQVINPVYMATRKIKHKGYINKLHDMAVKKETEKYVLK